MNNIAREILMNFITKWKALMVLVAGFLLSCQSGTQKRYLINVELMGEPIHTTVDSSRAREFLEGNFDSPEDDRIRKLMTKYDGHELNNTTLKMIAEETSVDFGAAYFIHRIWRDPGHRNLQKRFYEAVERIEAGAEPIAEIPGLSKKERESYVILFVPGMLYLTKPETKGDLAGPRQLLAAQGFRTELVEIEEVGTVEENGKIIARAILKHQQTKVILVSTSKGGPDVAYALGTVLSEGESRHVQAWVSVGGVLRGSQLADKTRSGIEYWPLRLYGFFKGFDVPAVLDSLSVQKSLERFQRQRIPRHIYILHYVSIPFSGSVIDEVRDPYMYLKKFGPNDGIVLLSEQILRNGHVVLAVGFDHWFRDPRIDIKTLALTGIVLENVRNRSAKH
jgi:hypothetical protein